MVVEYTKPVYMTDEVHALTRCSRIGNKSFDLQYALIKKENDIITLLAKGESVIVCFDYLKKVSVPVLEDWVKKM
jgi:acyl-CoA thioester hydrolase